MCIARILLECNQLLTSKLINNFILTMIKWQMLLIIDRAVALPLLIPLVCTVGSCLSERIGTEGCSDNRNVRIIEVLTNSIDNTCLKT